MKTPSLYAELKTELKRIDKSIFVFDEHNGNALVERDWESIKQQIIELAANCDNYDQDILAMREDEDRELAASASSASPR